MRRIVCHERDDWRSTAEACGFDFHTIDGERYWDERAYYAFTLEEIERIEKEVARATGGVEDLDVSGIFLVPHQLVDHA